MYLTGQFKISRESYSSRYRVSRIGNCITGVIFTINTILLKSIVNKVFYAYISHVNLKYLKNFYFSGFRVFKISNFIIELLYYKYNTFDKELATNFFMRKSGRSI